MLLCGNCTFLDTPRAALIECNLCGRSSRFIHVLIPVITRSSLLLCPSLFSCYTWFMCNFIASSPSTGARQPFPAWRLQTGCAPSEGVYNHHRALLASQGAAGTEGACAGKWLLSLDFLCVQKSKMQLSMCTLELTYTIRLKRSVTPVLFVVMFVASQEAPAAHSSHEIAVLCHMSPKSTCVYTQHS